MVSKKGDDPVSEWLRAAKEELEQLVFERTAELRAANARLEWARDELESRVAQRTEELRVANERLAQDISARIVTEAALRDAKAAADAASRAKSAFLANMS